jgi:heme A synthase
MKPSSGTPEEARPFHRILTGSLGVLLLVAAIVGIAIQDSIEWRAALVALLLAGLGMDAVVGAIRGRKALVTRLGPLP